MSQKESKPKVPAEGHAAAPAAAPEKKRIELRKKVLDAWENLRSKLVKRFPLLARVFRWSADLALALRSRDRPTRSMAWFALTFLLMAVWLTSWGGYRVFFYQRFPHAGTHRKIENPEEVLARQRAEISRVRESLIDLPELQIAMIVDGLAKRPVKVELDISIEFESPETGSWAASRKSDFRSEVVTAISTMSGMTREILLTPEGKARVRDRIRKRMDDWLPSGARVKRVYFNQFVVR